MLSSEREASELNTVDVATVETELRRRGETAGLAAARGRLANSSRSFLARAMSSFACFAARLAVLASRCFSMKVLRLGAGADASFLEVDLGLSGWVSELLELLSLIHI